MTAESSGPLFDLVLSRHAPTDALPVAAHIRQTGSMVVAFEVVGVPAAMANTVHEQLKIPRPIQDLTPQTVFSTRVRAYLQRGITTRIYDASAEAPECDASLNALDTLATVMGDAINPDILSGELQAKADSVLRVLAATDAARDRLSAEQLDEYAQEFDFLPDEIFSAVGGLAHTGIAAELRLRGRRARVTPIGSMIDSAHLKLLHLIRTNPSATLPPAWLAREALNYTYAGSGLLLPAQDPGNLTPNDYLIASENIDTVMRGLTDPEVSATHRAVDTIKTDKGQSYDKRRKDFLKLLGTVAKHSLTREYLAHGATTTIEHALATL